MRLLPLTNCTLFALVDDEDFERISRFGWYAFKAGRNWYAARMIRIRPGYSGQRKLLMHNAIAKPPAGRKWDHIDGDGLNNQKRNLRPATDAQNQANSRKRVDNKSGFKGVSWHRQHQKWYCSLQHSKKQHFIGLFIDPADAARAYDQAALRLKGAFARLNFPLPISKS
jgi:hypothetical protein